LSDQDGLFVLSVMETSGHRKIQGQLKGKWSGSERYVKAGFRAGAEWAERGGVLPRTQLCAPHFFAWKKRLREAATPRQPQGGEAGTVRGSKAGGRGAGREASGGGEEADDKTNHQSCSLFCVRCFFGGMLRHCWHGGGQGELLRQVRTSRTKNGLRQENRLNHRVVQSDDHIEITRVEQGSRTTNRYPLNGSEEAYTSPGGLAGKCQAQLKDKYLVLESEVTSKPSPNAPPVRIHTKERWQLSSDSKTLTVKSDVDFPDAPRDVSSVVGESGSGTQKYTKVENP
jgi:hypothetical protein